MLCFDKGEACLREGKMSYLDKKAMAGIEVERLSVNKFPDATKRLFQRQHSLLLTTL